MALLPAPQIFWLMTPPGDATEGTLDALLALLENGDIVVDGGNSDFSDTLRRSARLREHGITLVDAGVSGGTQGARVGNSSAGHFAKAVHNGVEYTLMQGGYELLTASEIDVDLLATLNAWQNGC
ncbi:NAD(P)-binding domain-containing protein [Sodalis glossinidius]|nr:NAD(P)-binding domain-containing protein [Sodalis glossinidius]